MEHTETPEDTVGAIANEMFRLATSDGPFKVTEKAIGGIELSVYANAAPSLGALYEVCKSHDEKTFLVSSTTNYSFRETYDAAVRYAYILQSQYAIQKGERVAIAMRNCPEWIFAFMAVTAIGAVAVPLNSWWQAGELDFAIKDSECKLLFVDKMILKRLGNKPRVPHICVEDENLFLQSETTETKSTNLNPNRVNINPDSPATIFYTSGSTGRSKGVVSSHRAIISAITAWLHAAEAAANVGSSPPAEMSNFATLCSLPLFHVTGAISQFLYSIPIGRKLVLMHKWDAELALDLIEKEKIAFFNGAPAMIMDLLNTKTGQRDLSSLLVVGGAGAASPPEQVKKLGKVLPHTQPQNGYGMTETNALGTLLYGDAYITKPASAGLPLLPIVQIKLVDESGDVGLPGKEGEILIRSVSNFQGYWKDEEATKQTLQNGWVHSGDIGTMDETGHLYIVGRKKEIIIRGGENISCLEVEAALAELEGIRELAVFSKPDQRLGEIVALAVYPSENHRISLENIQSFLENKLAHFKIPEWLTVFDAPLPRTATGKIDRRAIQKTVF